MTLLASIVDGEALFELIWVGAVAGVGVPAAFGVALLGATRAGDLRRSGRMPEAALYAVLGAAAIAFVAAAVAFGIVEMTKK